MLVGRSTIDESRAGYPRFIPVGCHLSLQLIPEQHECGTSPEQITLQLNQIGAIVDSVPRERPLL
jgi:hypothetical protein